LIEEYFSEVFQFLIGGNEVKAMYEISIVNAVGLKKSDFTTTSALKSSNSISTILASKAPSGNFQTACLATFF
jgi:hypothetical protein